MKALKAPLNREGERVAAPPREIDPISRETLELLKAQIQNPSDDDDEGTVHAAIAQVYEGLKLPTEAAMWFRRASAHCAKRKNSAQEVQYAKAAERNAPAQKGRGSEPTPRIARPRGRG